MSFLVIVAALLMDRLLGEPRRYHPLVGFGFCANWVEIKFNTKPGKTLSTLTGVIATSTLVTPFVLACMLLVRLTGSYAPILDAVLVYWAIGAHSLRQHVFAVKAQLSIDDLVTARDKLSRIVSRSTADMNEQQISAAAVETTLENGCDAIFGVLFWYLIGGAPMVVAYRLVNTLDAMWGYRSYRFEYFGKAAAKLDDLLNLIPARLTALSYALLGNTRSALHSWRNHASKLTSPNAGPVMSAGAGSLDLKLGGPAHYPRSAETPIEKPFFGGQNQPQTNDIERAVNLINRTVFTWLVFIGVACLYSSAVNQWSLL